MRKTRLIILPARCLAMIGFLLLYLACPILAEMSRGKPDRGLASSFQLEVLEHCASPPEDPGEGGCADSRNALAKMTRTVPPDNEHDNTCSATDVFLLENTCTVDQRPAENVHGHSRQAKRYANASPRRLLAARSTDPPAAVVKIQAPRRQVKYRSLRRREVPHEELAVTSQRQGITTTRTLLPVQSAARIASERTDTVRKALSMEHDVPKETAKKLLSRRIPELEASRRTLAERQYPSRTVPDSRALTERDISRRQSKERHASRRTMERGMLQIDGSRRFIFDRQPFHKLSADRRVSESDISTRMSTERKSSLRTSTDHRMYESDVARRSFVARQSERRMSTERRISEPAASRLSVKRESSRRLLTDRRMFEYSPYRRMSTERQSRSLASERISKIRFESMASSERSFSGTRSSRSLTTDIRRDGSRKTRLGIRALSEEIQGSRVSTERLYPERRSISRGVQPEERRHYAEKSFSRRNSLDEARRSDEQPLKRSLSEARIKSERINIIRRITRNINSHISSDRRDSRTFTSTGIAIRSSSTGRGSDERRNVRMSNERLFRLTSPVRHLSLSSEQKKNQRQSSESISRISADRRNIRIFNDRLSPKISSDPIETFKLSDERLSTVSSNKLLPYRNSINRVDIYRIAGNRRISATSNEIISSPRLSATRRTSQERRSLTLHHEMALFRLSRRHAPLEERRNMKFNHERRPLSTEWFSRRASDRKTEERRLSSDRSAPFRISKESRASKSSPATDRLLTTSRKIFYANPLGGRTVQDAYRRLPEHHASRRIVTRSISDELRSSGISVSRNNHATESETRRSLGRNSAEKKSKATIAERLNKLGDSRRISARKLIPEKKLTFTERSTMSAGISVSVTNYRRISAERLVLERNSRRWSERLASVRYSRISAKRWTSERNSRSSEHLSSVRDSRISAERLTPERNTRRSPERLASVRDSRISAERLTPERNTRRSPERLASVRVSRISAERLTPEGNTGRSPERLASGRDSRISAERLTPERNTRRSPELLASVRDSRISAKRLTSERNARRSPERLASVRVSRISAERLTPERNTGRSPERLASVRDSRISAERLTPERNTRRSPERLASVRYSRISAERLTPERITRRSPERLASVRYSRISAERLTSKRQSRRSTEVTSSVRDLTRISPERMVSARDSRKYAERLALVRNIRTVSVNQMAFGENSQQSVERSVSLRKSRQISTRSSTSADPTVTVVGTRISAKRSVSERDSRRSAERLAPVTISRVYTDRLAFVRRSVGSWALGRDFRRSSTVPLVFEVDFRRSVERLATYINSRTSAQLVSQMESRKSVNYSSSLRKPDSLTSARKSRTSVERMSFLRMVNERRSVLKQYSTDRFATKKLAARASNRAVFSERLVSQPEQVSTIRFTLKAPEHHSTKRMTNVRNTKPSYGRISNNQDLYQSFGLSERQFNTMDNTTLKTESLLSIGLPLGTIQKSIINFMPAQYSSWTDKITEYVSSALATLTLIWPALTIWKGNALEYLTSLDVVLGFSPKMDHFNSFFADKPTSNYAFVPDDLALVGSTKPAPAVMREKGGLLATLIGGGVSAAVMILSTKPK